MRHKKRKIVRRIIFALLALCAAAAVSVMLIDNYVKTSAGGRIISPEEASGLKADCILVLGAGVMPDGRPTAMLEDRLLQSIELYGSGASGKILMSGDHGRKNYDEVNTMKRFARDAGIPSEDVFMDHAGFSTYESLYRARDIFKAKKIIIVTQEYHMYRALYIADRLGLEAYGVPSDPREYAGQDLRELREILARVKDFFNVLIMPEPTYLGDAIPIFGNGDLTNDS